MKVQTSELVQFVGKNCVLAYFTNNILCGRDSSVDSTSQAVLQSCDSSGHSNINPMAAYHIPKRQKITPSDQQAKGKKQRSLQAKSKDIDRRGDSARQLHLQANALGETTTFMNLLRGSTAVDALQTETPQEKATQIKAAGWGQQFRRMLANCPATSDAKTNRSQLDALEAAVKNFGRKIKGQDGLWMLNGMKSGKYPYHFLADCYS